MARILVTRPLPTPATDRLTGHDVTLRSETTPMSLAEMVAALEAYDVILPTLGDLFSAEVFAAAKSIRTRILANFGVGYNHLDVASARTHGIVVSNTPGAVTDATADIAMTLILSTARRAGEGERLLRAGGWAGWHPMQLLGQHVTGKRVGIVGMGRIGQAIARRCHHGFGMEVLFHNRSPKTVDLPATQVATLAELAGQVDFLVAAVSGGAATHHLIGAEVFAAMQPHGIFVNISRGDVVDETALVDALAAGEIAGAGLDVYEQEPMVPSALVGMENVTLLPHLGTATLEVRTAMANMAVDNVLSWLDTGAVLNPV